MSERTNILLYNRMNNFSLENYAANNNINKKKNMVKFCIGKLYFVREKV